MASNITISKARNDSKWIKNSDWHINTSWPERNPTNGTRVEKHSRSNTLFTTARTTGTAILVLDSLQEALGLDPDNAEKMLKFLKQTKLYNLI